MRTLDQKLAALRAQASQTSALVEAFGEDRYRGWFGRETFVDGARFVDHALALPASDLAA